MTTVSAKNVTGGDFTNLFQAYRSFTDNNEKSEKEIESSVLGIYLNQAEVYGFSDTGKYTKFGDFGFLVSGSTTNMCFIDFKKKISFLLVYDEIPNWNGHEARIYPFKKTLCDPALNPKGGDSFMVENFIHVNKAGRANVSKKVIEDRGFLTQVRVAVETVNISTEIIRPFS